MSGTLTSDGERAIKGHAIRRLDTTDLESRVKSMYERDAGEPHQQFHFVPAAASRNGPIPLPFVLPVIRTGPHCGPYGTLPTTDM